MSFAGILKGAAAAIALTVLAAAVLAAMMYFSDVPELLVSALIFLIGALSCAVGGFFVCRAAGTKGLANGAAVGLLYYIVLAAAALIIRRELPLDAHMLIMLAAALLSGMLGGVLGVSRT